MSGNRRYPTLALVGLDRHVSAVADHPRVTETTGERPGEAIPDDTQTSVTTAGPPARPDSALTPALTGPVAGPAGRVLPIGAEAAVAPELLRRLLEAEQAGQGAYAANGDRARFADTRRWMTWCAERRVCPLPAAPGDVATFLREHAATCRPATLARWASTIAFRHRQAGVADPTKTEPVRLALRAIRRSAAAGVGPAAATSADESAAASPGAERASLPGGQRQALALRQATVRRIEDVLARRAAGGPPPLADLRDIALLRVARDLLARRSELVALNVADVQDADTGDGSGTALIRRSKTDQEGEGAVGYLAPETMSALRAWLTAAGVTRGPLFRAVNRHGQVGTRALGADDVARRFKRLAAVAGLDPTQVSGHSARVGMAQDLVGAGFGLPEILQAGRWKTATMVARYARAQAARHGAVARFHEGGRRDDPASSFARRETSS
jgi:integrase